MVESQAEESDPRHLPSRQEELTTVYMLNTSCVQIWEARLDKMWAELEALIPILRILLLLGKMI